MFASMCNLISDEAGRRPISFKNDGKRQNKPVLGGDFQVFLRNQKGDVGKQAFTETDSKKPRRAGLFKPNY